MHEIVVKALAFEIRPLRLGLGVADLDFMILYLSFLHSNTYCTNIRMDFLKVLSWP